MRGIGRLILMIISLLLIGIVVVSFLEFFNIIDVPQALSLKYLMGKSDVTEVSTNSTEIRNKVVDNRIIKYVETEEGTSIIDENIIVGTSVPQASAQTNQDVKRFHYNQLSNTSKIIYTELYNNIDNLKSGVYNVEFKESFSEVLSQPNGTDLLTEYFNLAINALTFDNPELFFINLNKTYLLTQQITYPTGNVKYKVSIGTNKGESYLADGFQNAVDVEEALITTRTYRDAIISRANMETSDKGKVRVVHDYLVDTINYDTSLTKENIYNIYGALNNKESVCEGYARAFKYILDELGVPCIIVCGMATNSKGEVEDHAWNYVYVNDRWYAVDVTWDDPILIGGGILTSELKYKYFLMGRSTFEYNHKEDGYIVGDTFAFKYPTLSLTDY